MNNDLRDATAALRRELDAAPGVGHESELRSAPEDDLALLGGAIPNAAELLQCLADWYAVLCRDKPLREALELRASLVERLTASETSFGRTARAVSVTFGDVLWKCDSARPASGLVRPIIAGADENNRIDPKEGEPVIPRVRERKQLLDLGGAIEYELEHTNCADKRAVLNSLLSECYDLIDKSAGLRVDECFWLWRFSTDRQLARTCLTTDLTGPAIVPFLRSALELFGGEEPLSDTRASVSPDKQKKARKRRRLNKHANQCIDRYRAYIRGGEPQTMNFVVKEYVSENKDVSESGTLRILNDNSDHWKPSE